jgi:hypothetical protein
MEEKQKKQSYRLWDSIQIPSDTVDSSHHGRHLQSNERGIIRDLAKDWHTADTRVSSVQFGVHVLIAKFSYMNNTNSAVAIPLSSDGHESNGTVLQLVLGSM